MQYDCKVTGRVIRAIRLKKGKTQEVVSGFAGIDRTHWTRIESGTLEASVDTLWRMANALDTPLSEIIRQVESELGAMEQ